MEVWNIYETRIAMKLDAKDPHLNRLKTASVKQKVAMVFDKSQIEHEN